MPIRLLDETVISWLTVEKVQIKMLILIELRHIGLTNNFWENSLQNGSI